MHCGGRPFEPRHDIRVGDRIAADADELRHHDVRSREQGERTDEHRRPEEEDRDPLPPTLGDAVGEGREHDQQRRRRHRIGGEAEHVDEREPRLGEDLEVEMHEGLVRRADEHRGRPERDEQCDPRRRDREQPHAEHEQRQRTEQRPGEAVVRVDVGVDEAAHDDDVDQRGDPDRAERREAHPPAVHALIVLLPAQSGRGSSVFFRGGWPPFRVRSAGARRRAGPCPPSSRCRTARPPRCAPCRGPRRRGLGCSRARRCTPMPKRPPRGRIRHR